MSNHTQNNAWINTLIRQCVNKLPPIYIYAILVTIAFLFLGFENFKESRLFLKKDIYTQSQVQQQYNTRADYERLKIGVTQVEVESILGRGIEIKRSHFVNTLIWQNSDKSSIKAIFDSGKLQSKHQENLK